MADTTSGMVAQNRRARHDYDILEQFEAGIVLTGSEIKSVRDHRVQLQGSYARVKNGELWLEEANIAAYAQAGYSGHAPDRNRKLLLHKRQITHIMERVGEQGLTIIPLSMYLKGGRAKVEIGLARGLHHYDKRHQIAERDAERQMQRAVRQRA